MAPHPAQLVDQLCVEFEREVNQMSKDFPIKPNRVARMSQEVSKWLVNGL